MIKSAGILVYRFKEQPEFFLVHPGGPFFKNKDAGVWTIPKGELDNSEEPITAARREFLEETGIELDGTFIELHPIIQKAGKTVYAWAIEYDIDPHKLISNTFAIEWPPKSGAQKEFPEVDKAGWFTVEEAKQKINMAQFALIEELVLILNAPR